MKITHLLFDYDNTLGLTELPAFTACCGVVNKLLSAKDVSVQFTVESLMSRFVGRSFRRMATELSTEHNFGFADGELDLLVADEVDAVVARLAVDIQATPGANALLASLVGRFNLSVVSSSALRRVTTCLEGAIQDSFFGGQVFSAASYNSSKPDPKVYLEAIKALNVKPESAAAIEDSNSGARAAVAAGITTIGYTGAYSLDEREELSKVLLAAGCVVVINDWSEFEAALSSIQTC